MADPVAPAAGGATLYPDGGANPAGKPEAAIDPATGQPKFAAAPAPIPEAPIAAAPAVVDPAAPVAEVPKPEVEVKPEAPVEEAKPLDLTPYADLKLAEGFEVDAPTMDAFKTAAAELGLPKEGAEKLLGMYQEVAKKQVESIMSAVAARDTEAHTTNLSAINAMPEFQGEAREQSLTYLGRMMDEFGTPETRAAFDASGAGDNPHVVKYLLGIAQALLEGEPTPGGQPGNLAGPKQGSARRRTPGEVLGYNQPSN